MVDVHWGTPFNGGPGSAGFAVGLDDLKVFFNLKISMTLWHWVSQGTMKEDVGWIKLKLFALSENIFLIV